MLRESSRRPAGPRSTKPTGTNHSIPRRWSWKWARPSCGTT